VTGGSSHLSSSSFTVDLHRGIFGEAHVLVRLVQGHMAKNGGRRTPSKPCLTPETLATASLACTSSLPLSDIHAIGWKSDLLQDLPSSQTKG
jgi:hypothetical protein